MGRGNLGLVEMEGLKAYIPALILAVLGIVLQGILSNAITIGYATPNFIVAVALVIAAVYPTFASVVCGFALGLLYNLLCSGTVGSMAVVLTLLTYAVVIIFSSMENPNLVFGLVAMLVCGFIAELAYGLLVGAFVSGISVSEALVYRALPCGVYDALITCVLYPVPALIVRALANRMQGPSGWSI